MNLSLLMTYDANPATEAAITNMLRANQVDYSLAPRKEREGVIQSEVKNLTIGQIVNISNNMGRWIPEVSLVGWKDK